MTDRFVVRAVVLGLFTLALGSLIASVVLAINGTDIPEFLKYVGTTAIGAFAGVLSKTSTEPQPVVVQDQPVAVDPVGVTKAVRKATGRGRRGDAGHADIVLALAVAVGVFVGYLLAYALVHAVR